MNRVARATHRRRTPAITRRSARSTKPAQRALALLRAILPPSDYVQFLKLGYIDIPSPSCPDWTYRLARKGGFAWLYQEDQPIEWLCLQPREPLPRDDVVLMHLLFIRASEDEYLQEANHLSLDNPDDPLIQLMAEILDPPWEHNIGRVSAPLGETERE